MSEGVAAHIRKIFKVAKMLPAFKYSLKITNIENEVLAVLERQRQQLHDHIAKFPEDPDTIGGMNPISVQHWSMNIDEWLSELKRKVDVVAEEKSDGLDEKYDVTVTDDAIEFRKKGWKPAEWAEEA